MMSNSGPESLMLNGINISKDSILPGNTANTVKGNLLIDKVYEFLKQWYNPDDLLVLKTSGSSGPPKEIHLSKSAMMASALMTGRFFGLKPGMTALLCLSPDYVAGKMMIVRAITLGLNLLTTNVGSNPLENLRQKADFSAMVPLQVAKTFENGKERFDLLKTLIIGGEGITTRLEQALQELNTQCWHTYGMTETLSHVALRAINGPDRSQWFTPLAGVKVSTDKRGCLVIKAHELNQQKVITNDLVILKGNKFRILGRLDNVIITAGHKLFPPILEKKIDPVIPFPFFITGWLQDDTGQVPVLFVEADKNSYDAKSISDKIVDLLLPHEMPRKIILVDKFVYLESGKVDKRSTSEKYRNQ